MIDWLRIKSVDFEFREIEWGTFKDLGRLDSITGGSVELSAFTELKAVATLDFKGAQAPTSEMVRIICNATDLDGNKASVPIATLFCACDEPLHTPTGVAGTLSCSSVLDVLAGDGYGHPYTIKAGTQAVSQAIAMCNIKGIPVNNPDPSAYIIKSDHTFESSASHLEVVNWLLDAAGYGSAQVDAYGSVVMAPYVEPTERATSMTFAADRKSILYPELTQKNDWRDSPNKIILNYSNDKESLYAASTNVDPNSPASIVSRRMYKLEAEDVQELDGVTQKQRLKNLEAQALKKLLDNSSEIEYVTFQSQYVPLSPNDAIEIEGIINDVWKGAVTSMHLDLTASMPCSIEARRFIRRDLKTITWSEVL